MLSHGIPMPWQIIRREVHGSKPLLFDILEQLWQLTKEANVDLYIDNISSGLLWIATHHPEILNDESNVLSDISIKRLFFRDSWELIDKPLETKALNILLSSNICRNLERFCGYIYSINILMDFPHLFDIRLALGRHNAASLIDEINRFQPEEYKYASEGITVHLKCGELDLDSLSPSSQYISSVFISNASDEDIAWIVKATTKFLSHTTSDVHFRDLMLTNSKMTAAGVIAIAKAIKKTHINLDNIRCQTPYINAENKIPGYLDIEDFAYRFDTKFCIEFHEIDVEEEINVFDY